MEYAILAGIIVAAVIIAIDVARQHRLERRRLDLPAILRDRLGDASGNAEGSGPAGLTIAGPAPTPVPVGDAPGGVWSYVEELVDPEAIRPKLAAGTEVVMFQLRWGNDYGMVASPNHRVHYYLDPWEAELVRQMDGSRSVGELIVDRLERDGSLDAGAVVGIVESLRMGGMLDPAPIDLTTLLPQRLDTSTGGRRKLRQFLKTMRLSWDGTDAFISSLYDGGFRFVFAKAAVIGGLAIAAIGLIAYASVVVSGRFELTIGNPPLQTVILIALGFVLTAAHELGHALTLKHFGRRIGSSGFLLYYGSPAFFVDSSDGLMLSAPRRIAQSAAGPLAETVLAGISSIVLFAFPGAAVAPFLFKFSFINYYVILMNLIPLLELDGYWILCDAIQVQDLRPRSLAFIQRDLWRKLWRRERFTPQEIGLALYGIVGLAFTIFTLLLGLYFWRKVFGQLLIDLWNMGPGPRLLMLVLVLVLAGPVIRGFLTAGRASWRRARAVWRRFRFRIETSWRVEAAALIDDLPAFDDLPVDALNDLAGRVKLRTVPRGQAVFFRGDPADSFYVVRKGTAAVEDEDPTTGDTQVLTTLSRGGSFGELGLLQRAPRQATVRAVDDLELFEIDRPTFDRLLADAIEVPDLAPTMQAYAELKQLPAFRSLTFDELADVLEHGDWVSAAPGDVLVQEGAPGDAFYAIGSGQVNVERGGDVVRSMGPGDHFGEIALLEDIPRTASVIATTPSRIFRLNRDGFETLIAESFRRGTLKRSRGRTAQH